MSDIREQVANEIAAQYADTNAGRTVACAEAVLAVANPIIRAQVLSELARKAEENGWYLHRDHDDGYVVTGDYLADWLRAQTTL
jgi:hypothetical protein